VERSNAWVLENKHLALRYDRLGFIAGPARNSLHILGCRTTRPGILKTASNGFLLTHFFQPLEHGT
jgi:hypothetical protein